MAKRTRKNTVLPVRSGAATSLVVHPKVDANVGVDQQAIVAVAIHKAEVTLKGQLAEAKASIESENKALKSANDRFIESLKATFNVKYGEQIKALEFQLTALGFSDEDNKQMLHPEFQVSNALAAVKEGKSEYKMYVCLGGTYFKSDLVLPLVPESVAAYEDAVAAQGRAQAASDRYLDLQNQLHALPSLERQARAQLAEKILSSTAEGRELLDAVTIDLSSSKVRALIGS